MKDPPSPDNEADRLAALRALRVLDTDPEESFDRLARLAARIFDVPIAHISLIDERREWYKARHGVEPQEGERRLALCAHTILSDDVLVVEDTREDSRFSDNPQVTGERPIRFYAGAPLLAAPGVAVGVLCIKDHRPRSLPPDGARMLSDLAAIAMEELQQRLAGSELTKWRQVFERADWGIAMAEGDNPTLDTINHAFAEMHGWKRDELLGRPIVDVFAPEAKPTVAVNIRKVMEQGHHVWESLHCRKDGTVFPVQVDAVAVRDRKGKILYRAAHVQDISERKRAEHELGMRNLLLRTQQETSLDGILVVDRDGRFASFNRRFVSMWHLPQEVMRAGHDEEGLQHAMRQLEHPEQFLERVRYLYDHPTESSADVLQLKDGRVFDRYSAPMLGSDGQYYGRVWYFRDVTDRVRAEQSLRKSEERLKRVLESAMDAIVAVDDGGNIRLFNAAAEDVFRVSATEVLDRGFDRFCSPGLRELLDRCAKVFGRRATGKRYLWAPDGLTAVRGDGEEFPVEATVSQVEASTGRLFTLILRDVNERVRAEDELRQLQLENLYLQEEFRNELGFEEIIGRSAGMREVVALLRQVAETDTTVLVTGETGTGKELIARAIHRLSPRAETMLVRVNCSALPAGLIESELFGHEKGAFTGALSRKIGRFELADGGTIFLDEIGDLPQELQAKLLRVLQEGEFERVGGTATLRVDVRVIAATNVDLAAAVEQGRFRSDLFYRLNVFPIRVPPLRERRDDIPLLAQHFTQQHGARLGKRIESIPRPTLDRLTAYDWPGNVRELQNVIERAVILSRGGTLDAATLPGAGAGAGPEGPGGMPTLEEVERRHIRAVLQRTGGQVGGRGGAAELLGLKRTTLQARMRKLGITPRRD